MLLLGVLGTVFGLLLSRSREAGGLGRLGVLKCRGWFADVARNAHHVCYNHVMSKAGVCIPVTVTCWIP